MPMAELKRFGIIKPPPEGKKWKFVKAYKLKNTGAWDDAKTTEIKKFINQNVIPWLQEYDKPSACSFALATFNDTKVIVILLDEDSGCDPWEGRGVVNPGDRFIPAIPNLDEYVDGRYQDGLSLVFEELVDWTKP